MARKKKIVVAKLTVRLDDGEYKALLRLKGILSVRTESKAVIQAIIDLPYYLDQFKQLEILNLNLNNENKDYKAWFELARQEEAKRQIIEDQLYQSSQLHGSGTETD